MIKILSSNLEQRGMITAFESMIYTRSWYGVGEFQLVVHKDTPYVSEIAKGTFLALDKRKVGVVRHREIQVDENGKATENWLFKGYTLKGIVGKRSTVPPPDIAYDNKSGDAETVLKHYVENNLINPFPLKDPITGELENPYKRKVPNLVVAPNQNRGKHVTWRTRGKNLAEELERISTLGNIGWDITLDTTNNQLIFDVFEGVERHVNQSANAPVYFSPEFGNVKSQTFTDSDLNMRNVGYIAGQGEGVDRRFIVIGDAEGLDREEVFVDARDVETTAELNDRGAQKMNELQNEMYFEAQIMTPVKKITYDYDHNTFLSPYQPDYSRTKKTEMIGPFVYQLDYDLGDVVTIMNREWGVIVDRPIIEFTEVYEAGGFQLEAVFGQKRPTLLSKLKEKFYEMEGELKK